MGVARRGGRLALLSVAALVALAVLSFAPAPAPVLAQGDGVTLEWFGWSHYRLTSPMGKVIHINPFINGNPDASIGVDDITKVDLVLPSDGHGDETGQTIAIAQKTGARVFAPFELGTALTAQGVPAAQVVRASPGDRIVMDGITIHQSGVQRSGGRFLHHLRERLDRLLQRKLGGDTGSGDVGCRLQAGRDDLPHVSRA
jgi:L-ascorbate metabolism protein UlaG (beta-lactamase superfamily)